MTKICNSQSQTNNQQKQSNNSEIQANNPQKKTKLQKFKAIVGIGIAFIYLIVFILYSVYLLKSIYELNILFLTFAALQIIHQVVYAKKNEVFIKFMKYFMIQNYFESVTVEYEEEMQKQNAMLCIHPHGIYTIGLLLNLNAYIHLPALSSRFLLTTPILGLLVKWWGFESVDGASFQNFCQRGASFALVPGGFEEATLTTPDKDRVYIKSRKGFIKYGLKYGYTVYPMYTFNENKLFNTLGDTLLNFRLKLNKLKLVTSVFYSKYLLLMPDPNYHLRSVVGKGLKLPRIENPTNQDVDKYHEMYINDLNDLFNRHKAKFNNQNELIIY